MSKKFGISITNPKAMYTLGHISGTADNFTSVTTHITGSSDSLDDGALVKNVGPKVLKVAISGVTHGANTGFVLNENEQLFIETTSLNGVLVKNNRASEGITFSLYAN